MGMFDSIKVDADNVCNIVVPDREFQTYNLDNQCWTFRITKEGKLIVETKPSDYGTPFDKQFETQLQDSRFDLNAIHNNKYCGVISFGGDVKDIGLWVDYTALIHNCEVQFVVTPVGDVVYSCGPESNNDFQEAIDRARTPDSSIIHPSWCAIMSTKHLLPSRESIKQTTNLLNDTLRKLGYNPDGTVCKKMEDQTIPEDSAFLESLNRALPGMINPDGTLDVTKIIMKPEYRYASRALMTKEKSEEGMNKEIKARKEILLKRLNEDKE